MIPSRTKLYSVRSVVALEQIAIQDYHIPAYELMERAGAAVFKLLNTRFSHCRRVLVLCGAGNNAGDGYVVARLAKNAGYEVSVVSLIDPGLLKDEAAQAYNDWLSVSSNVQATNDILNDVDIVVDSLLGTGLGRDIDSLWSNWIDHVNNASLPVISVDLPSGLYADTGAVSNGGAIKATVSMCFIALKQGMFSAFAKDYCGEILLDTLSLEDEVFDQVAADALLLNGVDYTLLPPRLASSHKGSFGHVLIVGGNKGMPGAVILAATAALRTGAGRVTILTLQEHVEAIASAVPEAMIKTCDGTKGEVDALLPAEFVQGITHIAIGMGLGQDDWAQRMLQYCLAMKKPMVIDADALNLLASKRYSVRSPVIITPHPGEAGRLLASLEHKSVDQAPKVQTERFTSAERLYSMLDSGGAVILKGSGTLIYDGESLKVCNLGTSAMATAGMGDVLSGIAVALMAQGIVIAEAAELAVCLHASAAQNVIGESSRGLLATDVVAALPEVLQ